MSPIGSVPAAPVKAELARRQKATVAILAAFLERPWHWYSARELMALSGALGWRTRVSEARRQLQAEGRGDIVWNRKVQTSSYRYEPQAPLGRDAAIYVEQRLF